MHTHEYRADLYALKTVNNQAKYAFRNLKYAFKYARKTQKDYKLITFF